MGKSGDTKMKAVFTIIEGANLTKPIYRRIGTGFVNRDGSLNIFLDALPVNGKLHIRDAIPHSKDESDDRAAVRRSAPPEKGDGDVEF